jgi:hypothetical protein
MLTEIIEVYYGECGLNQREQVCKQEGVSEFANLSNSERERRKQEFKNRIPNFLKMVLSAWKRDNMYAVKAVKIHIMS